MKVKRVPLHREPVNSVLLRIRPLVVNRRREPTSAITPAGASTLARCAERITAEGGYRIPPLELIYNACDFGHGTVKFVVGHEVVVAAVVAGEADFAVGFGEAFGLLLL